MRWAERRKVSSATTPASKTSQNSSSCKSAICAIATAATTHKALLIAESRTIDFFSCSAMLSPKILGKIIAIQAGVKIRGFSPGCGQMHAEPVARQAGHFFQGARLFKQVGGARHDIDAFNAMQVE